MRCYRVGKFDFLNKKDEKGNNKCNIKEKKSKEEKTNFPKKTENDNKINSHLVDNNFSLEKYQQKYKYDPRPDIEKDHYIWFQLLLIAENENKNIYNLLHGLRCCGCKLKLKNKCKLKLDLKNSPQLLNSFTPKEKLKKLPGNEKHKPKALFEKQAKQIERKKQVERQKKIDKLYKKAEKKIKEEELQPRLKGVVKVFNRINNQVKKLRDKSSGNLNITVVNNYFKSLRDKRKK